MEETLTSSDFKVEDITVWRQKLARNLLRAIAIVGAPVIVVAIYEAISRNFTWQLPVRLGAYGILLLIAFWPQVSYRMQALVMIGVFATFGLFNLTQFGFNGESALFLMSAALLTALFFERWAGHSAMLLLCLGILGIGWAFSGGQIVVFYAGTTVPRNTDFESWVLFAIVFFALGTAMQYAQGYLMVRLFSALERNAGLARELEAERTGLAQLVKQRTAAAEEARAEAETAVAALQAQMWQITGLAQVNAVMRGEQDIATLAQVVIRAVCNYVEAPVGALYLRDDDGVSLLGRYAYTTAPGLPERFRFGEGLVGQAAQDGHIRVLAHIPESQFLLASGLGESLLPHLLVAPFQYAGEICGVLELGGLHPFAPPQVRFIEQALEPIAVAFNTARNRARINTLLAETRQPEAGSPPAKS
ncbi:MAG TPA: GAF domain-containing protein [Anaerolineae bacterium]|nr:GAF domain-containing protein [Anaerolineae bacterium]